MRGTLILTESSSITKFKNYYFWSTLFPKRFFSLFRLFRQYILSDKVIERRKRTFSKKGLNQPLGPLKNQTLKSPKFVIIYPYHSYFRTQSQFNTYLYSQFWTNFAIYNFSNISWDISAFFNIHVVQIVYESRKVK